MVRPRQEKSSKFATIGETQEMLQAYEDYYQAGENRSYEKIAVKYKVTTQTIYNWSKRYGWKQRIEERNLKFSKKLEETTDAQAIGIRMKYSNELGKMVRDFLAYVEEMKRRYQQRLREYRIAKKKLDALKDEEKEAFRKANAQELVQPEPFVVIKNVQDIEKIVKLQMLMLGETAAAGEKDGKVEGMTKEERIEQLMKADKSVRELIAEAWRKTRPVSLLQGGKKAEPPR